LLVTAESKLLELPDIKDLVEPFDPASLTWPWRHSDPRVDVLQSEIMSIAGAQSSRTEAFSAIAARVSASRGLTPRQTPGQTPPYMTEGWYCCAEPGPEQTDLV
jgi:hypothetical protein